MVLLGGGWGLVSYERGAPVHPEGVRGQGALLRKPPFTPLSTETSQEMMEKRVHTWVPRS
jgi:hypothetical protein